MIRKIYYFSLGVIPTSVAVFNYFLGIQTVNESKDSSRVVITKKIYNWDQIDYLKGKEIVIHEPKFNLNFISVVKKVMGETVEENNNSWTLMVPYGNIYAQTPQFVSSNSTSLFSNMHQLSMVKGEVLFKF